MDLAESTPDELLQLLSGNNISASGVNNRRLKIDAHYGFSIASPSGMSEVNKRSFSSP